MVTFYEIPALHHAHIVDLQDRHIFENSKRLCYAAKYQFTSLPIRTIDLKDSSVKSIQPCSVHRNLVVHACALHVDQS